MGKNPLQSLIGDYIEIVKYISESEIWVIHFKTGAILSIGCMWRLLHNEQIILTSYDHGQLFGNIEHIDGAKELTEIKPHEIQSVDLNVKTGDIIIKIEKNYSLQIMSISSGYESWEFQGVNSKSVISVNGQLHFF